jgi:hypothetical protein
MKSDDRVILSSSTVMRMPSGTNRDNRAPRPTDGHRGVS